MSKIIKGAEGRTYELHDREGEPVLSRLVVTALAGLIVSVATRYGLPLDQGQADAIALVVVATAPVAGALWARRRAWSGEAVAEVVEQARKAGR